MNENLKTPNLFDFATNELSQDAFLCWLLSWSNGECAAKDQALHDTAVEFLQSLLDDTKQVAPDKQFQPKESFCITVTKQYKSIDILALIEQGGNKYALLIEDKTGTMMHGDQLERYEKTVKEDYPHHALVKVYLKTGEISQAATAEKSGYRVYSRKNLLDVLARRPDIDNAIFKDFYDYLKAKDDRYEMFRTKPVKDWVQEWNAWEGFYGALQQEMRDEKDFGWGYAANPTGGELVAYWGFRHYSGHGHVYLEIHRKSDGDYFLAFKVGEVPKESDRGAVRNTLHERLLQSAQAHGWRENVVRPKRFGSGNSMVFCQTKEQNCWLATDDTGYLDMNNCWLATDDKGYLDMNATIENFKKAKAILYDAVNATG